MADPNFVSFLQMLGLVLLFGLLRLLELAWSEWSRRRVARARVDAMLCCARVIEAAAQDADLTHRETAQAVRRLARAEAAASGLGPEAG